MSTSANYFPKTCFVKAKDTSDSTTKEDTNNENSNYKFSSNGKDIKDFYESLFSTSSSSSDEDEVIIISEHTPTHTKCTPKDLFEAAGNKSSDIGVIINHKDADLNIMDSYGWTPLMHAVSSGHLEGARLLLDKGANPALTRDKGGWSSLTLAQKQGGEMFTLLSEGPPFSSSSISKDKPAERDCDVCHASFADDKALHDTSVVHNFRYNMHHPDALKPKSTHYGLPESNRGFELMLKKGWDPEKGLGPSGSGKLYPVRTVLKRDRSGIGGSAEKARVTHFGPGDAASVAGPRRSSRYTHKGLKTLGKRELKRKIALEKKKTDIYRRELSDL